MDEFLFELGLGGLLGVLEGLEKGLLLGDFLVHHVIVIL